MGWSGIFWQNPANNWGQMKGGYNLTGAKSLKFWARGEKGGELITFNCGGMTGGKYYDTALATIGLVQLTTNWKQYGIDLRNEDLSYICGGFSVTFAMAQNPKGAVFYLDNICYSTDELSSELRFFDKPEESKDLFIKRDVSAFTHPWVKAISYSPFRNGQSPEIGIFPTYEQVKEDLKILEKNWGMIRIYAADKAADIILKVITNENIHLKVFLGLWISQYTNSNETEITNGIRLAGTYKDIVSAVVVGNEVLLFSSDHKTSFINMVHYIRRVRDQVVQPVSFADNYMFWLTPEARAIANELDFIMVHNYPLWDHVSIENAMHFTISYYESIQRKYLNQPIVYGEVGWCTKSDNPAMFISQANEQNQKKYFHDVMAWSSNNNVLTFFFDAFDEMWKANTPNDPERHWGLFTTDRLAKPAISDLYPERVEK